jgi:hypothetical protein
VSTPRTFRRDRIGFVTALYRTAGELAEFRIGPNPVRLVADPGIAYMVLQGNGDAFETIEPLDGNSVVPGDRWHRRGEWSARSIFGCCRTSACRLAVLCGCGLPLTPSQRANQNAQAARTWTDVLRSGFLQRYCAAGTASVDREMAGWERSGALEIYDQMQSVVDTVLQLTPTLTTGLTPDEVNRFVNHGRSTVPGTVAWTLHLVSRDADLAASLAAELDAIPEARPLSVADLEHLPRLRLTVTESLRLFPPRWAEVRRVVDPVTIAAVTIPRGTIMLTSQWLTHRLSAAFAQPERCDPDRFRAFLPVERELAFYPFGVDPFASSVSDATVAQVVVLVGTILRRYLVRPTGAGAPVPVARGRTLRPSGLRLSVVRRER